ncbi:MAG: hydrogenase formation protein HypD, partial [Calditrichaeota bacterium]
VCVTPIEKIDNALIIASKKNVIFTSFGDMLRVPGSKKSLLSVKADGADIRMVYSPLDTIKIAQENPDKQIVFFAVGFETTAPLTAMTLLTAKKLKLNNFSVLISHVLVPPAIEALQRNPATRVQGYLAAGHVCTVTGYEDYLTLANKYKTPIVVTGFEPVDILEGIYKVVKQLEEERYEVENQYSRAVTEKGNESAQAALRRVFRRSNQKWRGIGEIKNSGFTLSDEYSQFDAEAMFSLESKSVVEHEDCISGQILQGIKKPSACTSFGTSCTPQSPKGATMVSNEGACSAYYTYKKKETV